jgi:phage baseplate assembly protein V
MIDELVRVGIVTNRYPDRGTVRVQLVDVDEQVSYEIPVIFSKTLKDKAYYMPDIGEHVVCLFSGQGLEQGFCLGAIYSVSDAVPKSDNNIMHIRFEDGTIIEYDRKSHKLLADVKGDIEIKATGRADVECQGQIYIKSATDITIQAPNINMKGGSPTYGIFEGTFRLKGNLIIESGNIDCNGNIHATGAIIDDGGNTNHHSH